MMPKLWWLWRIKPHPKRKIADVTLPWSYVDTVPLDDEQLGGTLRGLSLDPSYAGYGPQIRAGLQTLHDLLEEIYERTLVAGVGTLFQQPIGAMRALRLDLHLLSRKSTGGFESRRQLVQLWLTPPVFQFLDAKKHLPDEFLREFGSPLERERGYRYFVNPEVFDAATEFLAGSLEKTVRVVKLEDTIKVIELMKEEGLTNELGNLILVALDAFLEKGAPDPRFNPRRNAAPKGTDPDIDIEGWTEQDEERYQRRLERRQKKRARRNAPTTVEDVISVAMDVALENREGWFLRANEILRRELSAEYLGRRSEKTPLVVAQCIRVIEGVEGTDQKLYRIWGKSKLVFKGKEPYVIVSTSRRMRTWGKTAIFEASEGTIARSIGDASWPMSIRGQRTTLGGGANWSVDSHQEALGEVGVTHVVPCDARVRQ